MYYFNSIHFSTIPNTQRKKANLPIGISLSIVENIDGRWVSGQGFGEKTEG
jgi:hypothetical protein